jgi:hypothetical protein
MPVQPCQLGFWPTTKVGPNGRADSFVDARYLENSAVLATFSIRKQRRLLGGSHGEGR